MTKQLFTDDIEMRPTILFDIDGVFNAWLNGQVDYWYGFPEVTPEMGAFAIDSEKKLFFPKAATAYGMPDSLTIQWSSEFAEIVRHYHDNHNVQYIWLTSWDEDADEIAKQCLWPNQEPIMEGFLSTSIHRKTDDSKSSQVCDLRNVWISRFVNGEIDHIPPIVHFDDFFVGDPRTPSSNWHGPFGEDKTDVKMSVSPYLFLDTNAHCGVTRKQWWKATEFLETNA